MNLATILDGAAALMPDWKDDPRLKEPAAAVTAAQAAIDDAEARLDRFGALVVAIDADLAASSNLKQATALEDRRDAALEEEAKAKRDLGRGKRALERATMSYEPLALAVKRDTAAAIKTEWRRRAVDLIAKAEAFKAAAAALHEVDKHVANIFPHDGSQHGMVLGLAGAGAEAFNSPQPLLGLHARLQATVLGRGHAKLDAWIALAREWTK